MLFVAREGLMLLTSRLSRSLSASRARAVNVNTTDATTGETFDAADKDKTGREQIHQLLNVSKRCVNDMELYLRRSVRCL